ALGAPRPARGPAGGEPVPPGRAGSRPRPGRGGPPVHRRRPAGPRPPPGLGGLMPQGTPANVPDDGLTTRQRRNRPLVIVHTGVGKGKSTAAFGLALRAWNQGWPVGVYQFVKSAKWRVGEELAFRALGKWHEQTGEGAEVQWQKMGEGWSWFQRAGAEADHAADAREGWEQIKRDLAAE